MTDRREFLKSAGGVVAAAYTSVPAPSNVLGADGLFARKLRSGDDPELVITTAPGRVFKRTSDSNREHVESWHTTLIVSSPTARDAEPMNLVVSMMEGSATRVVETYNGDDLKKMNLLAGGASTTAKAPFMVFAMRLWSTKPVAFGIDRVRCELTIRGTDARAEPSKMAKEIPIETFAQKTRLIFPFRGQGIITQGGADNDGHRNRSGMFAIDVLGLSELYAPMKSTGDNSESLVGWGRPIIAPAAGTVVVARSDRPDQPVIDISDPKYYAPEFPQGGDPGNHVVIDHGNSEFSMIAHFQKDTLTAKVGDLVTQGEQLGLLGSSGDNNAAHVHHQLQSGPEWLKSDALPHLYENGPGRFHDKGWMFNAK